MHVPILGETKVVRGCHFVFERGGGTDKILDKIGEMITCIVHVKYTFHHACLSPLPLIDYKNLKASNTTWPSTLCVLQ